MDTLQVLRDIGQRNNGDVYLGVVGPVRVGKSSFIKRFMEVVVLDQIQNEDDKKRAKDELPLSGQGKRLRRSNLNSFPRTRSPYRSTMR